MTREDNMQIISNLLSPEAVRRIVEKNYSDDVIEYISGYAPTAETFSNTKYKAETVEKLMGLMKEGLIDSYDIIELMEDSVSHSKNEQYIGRFVNTVTNETHHDTYAAFRTANVADVPYDYILLGIHQGVYEANNFGVVQMDKGLAKEMFDMGISLMVCKEYDNYSDLLDFETAYNEDSYTFVPVQRYRLASAINDLRHEPDWSDFKDYLKAQLGDNMDKLTPYILNDMRSKYHAELSMNRLADKVADEYDRFIKDIKQQPADRIVEAAYEIVQKDDIREYCSGTDYVLSQQELDELLAADNLLDRLYDKWDELSEVHSLYDMDIMLEETASDLKAERLERERKTEMSESKPDGLADKPHKPMKHSRR